MSCGLWVNTGIIPISMALPLVLMLLDSALTMDRTEHVLETALVVEGEREEKILGGGNI